MEIKIGDSVMVKPGVKDTDYDYDLSGWQGRVTHIEIDEGKYFEIAWDSVALSRMPAGLIETSLDEGFDYSIMWLNENELELTAPRDQQQDVDEKISALNEQFGYVSAEEQHKQIAQIHDNNDITS